MIFMAQRSGHCNTHSESPAFLGKRLGGLPLPVGSVLRVIGLLYAHLWVTVCDPLHVRPLHVHTARFLFFSPTVQHDDGKSQREWESERQVDAQVHKKANSLPSIIISIKNNKEDTGPKFYGLYANVLLKLTRKM